MKIWNYPHNARDRNVYCFYSQLRENATELGYELPLEQDLQQKLDFVPFGVGGGYDDDNTALCQGDGVAWLYQLAKAKGRLDIAQEIRKELRRIDYHIFDGKVCRIPTVNKSKDDAVWTRLLVVRFPAGVWSYGGKPDDIDYEECEKYFAWGSKYDPQKARTAAQSWRARRVKKGLHPQFCL